MKYGLCDVHAGSPCPLTQPSPLKQPRDVMAPVLSRVDLSCPIKSGSEFSSRKGMQKMCSSISIIYTTVILDHFDHVIHMADGENFFLSFAHNTLDSVRISKIQLNAVESVGKLSGGLAVRCSNPLLGLPCKRYECQPPEAAQHVSLAALSGAAYRRWACADAGQERQHGHIGGIPADCPLDARTCDDAVYCSACTEFRGPASWLACLTHN